MIDNGDIKKAFITGSHAYGRPNKSSDVDLVILVSEEDLKILKEEADESNNWECEGRYKEHAPQASCLRFGFLNLIVCTTQEQYDLWLKGTRRLKKKGPVKRSEACYLFAKLRALVSGSDKEEAERQAESARQAAIHRNKGAK